VIMNDLTNYANMVDNLSGRQAFSYSVQGWG